MTITIRTDHNIQSGEALTTWIEETISHDLAHYTGQITKMEIHLADENGPKGKGGGGDEIRCTLDAKVDGFPNFGVTAQDDTLQKALRGAAVKLKGALGSALEKRRGH